MVKHVHKDVYLISYASSVGGPGPGCGEGPLFLQQSSIFANLANKGATLHWQLTTTPNPTDSSKLVSVQRQCTQVAKEISHLVSDKKFFVTLGGDHSCAIGTWSGVKKAMPEQNLGLIWIDAHMDSHTPLTSPSGNIHGMPVACLLGYGEPVLTHIGTDTAKFKPENICMIGIRSFEEGEANLLKQLNVRIIGMEEVHHRGLDDVLKEAIQIATQGTEGYGVSIDIDSIDPADAPGTDVAEEDGLSGQELCQAAKIFAQDSRLIGLEIAEFDPERDQAQKTEKLITNLVKSITLGQ